MKLLVILLTSISLVVCNPRRPLTCQGNTFDNKGIFCFDGQRDTDLLLDSFLELGIDAQAMLASRPAPIIRIYYPPPEPTTTTTTTTTRPLTTTTTLPPSRRRAAAGWAPSGAKPCEDNNPSDAADNDCYLARYAQLKGDMFKQMETISDAVQTTQTYAEKLGSYIDSVSIPAFQEALGLTIQQGLPIMNQASTDAMNDLASYTRQAITDTGTFVNNLDTMANTSRLNLNAKIQQAFNNFTAMNIRNVNALIKRANDMNGAAGMMNFAQSLQSLNTQGSMMVLAHAANLSSAVSRLSLSGDTVNTNMFFAQSNLSTVKIPQQQQLSTNWVASKQSAINSSLATLIRNTISLNNISNVVTQTNNAISSTIQSASDDLNNLLSTKTGMATSRLSALNSTINAAVTGLAQSYMSLVSGVRAVQSNVQNGTFAAYEKEQTALQNIATFLTSYGVDFVSAWEVAAGARLTRLRGILKQVSSALKSNSSGTTGSGTSGVMSQVLASLAQAGAVQNEINAALMKRESANLLAMQTVINKASANGVNFPQILSNLTSAISNLQSTARTSDPLDFVSKIINSMDNLATQTTQLGGRISASMTSADQNATSQLDGYNLKVRDWWSDKLKTGVVASLAGNISNALLAQETRLDNVTASIENKRNTYAGMTSAALANVQSGQNSVYGNGQESTSVASNALTQVSMQATAGYNNLSQTVKYLKSDLNNLWLSAGGDIDNVNTMNEFKLALTTSSSGVRSDINTGSKIVQSTVGTSVDSFRGAISGSVTQPAKNLLNKMQAVNSGTLQAATKMNALTGTMESTLNRSMVALDSSLNDLLTREVSGNTLSALGQFQAASNQLTGTGMDIKNRISQGYETIQSANATLQTIQGSMAGQVSTAQSQYNQSMSSVNQLVASGLTIKSILDNEVSVLSSGLANMSKAFNQSILTGIKSVDFLNNWYSDSNASISVNWTNKYVSPVRSYFDDQVTNASQEITYRRAVSRPASDANIKTLIKEYSSNTSTMVTGLKQSAVAASAVSDRFISTMNSSLNQIKSNANVSLNVNSQLSQVQSIMDTVGGTVSSAAGGSASSILAAATAAGSGMTNASAVSASKTEAMTNAVNSAVKSASSSISTGLNAIGTLDSIVFANAADRANSGTIALNEITAANNKMRSMMQQAMLSAADNATSFSDVDVTDPLYSGNILQSVTGQLESWNSYSASQTVGLSNFGKDIQTGVSMEERKLAQKLFQTGMAVSNQTYALQGLLKSMSDEQSELQYRLSRLGRAVESFDKVVPRSGIVPSPFSTSDIASLSVSNETVTSQVTEEKKGLRAAENQVDAWLNSAR